MIEFWVSYQTMPLRWLFGWTVEQMLVVASLVAILATLLVFWLMVLSVCFGLLKRGDINENILK